MLHLIIMRVTFRFCTCLLFFSFFLFFKLWYLHVYVEGSNPQMDVYPSLTSMNPPAQDAMDTMMSRHQSPTQSSEENLDSYDDMFHFYKMTSKPRGNVTTQGAEQNLT